MKGLIFVWCKLRTYLISRMYKAGNKVCMPCHSECDTTCFGPGPGNCSKCKNVRDGPFCVKKCPDTKYSDEGDCKMCHYNCVYGCLGPNNTIGPYGCNSCDNALIVENVVVSTP